MFVLTHHSREQLSKQGGTTFTFVTDGVESAVEQARAAAGDKDVSVGGGANAVQQVIEAGLLDEIQINLVPFLLGGGVPLFGGADGGRVELEPTAVFEGPRVTHLRYRVGG